MARTETMSIADFMQGNYGAKKKREKVKKSIKKYAPVVVRVLITVGGAIVCSSFIDIPVFAGGDGALEVVAQPNDSLTNVLEGQLYQKVNEAFQPILYLFRALAYPVATVVGMGGAFFVMIGDTTKGFTLIQRAAFGFLLVNALPLLMNLLAQIAAAL